MSKQRLAPEPGPAAGQGGTTSGEQGTGHGVGAHHARARHAPHTVRDEELLRAYRLVPERNRTLAVRESGAGLPAQFFWDWLSGVWLRTRPGLLKRTPLTHAADSLGLFLLMIAAGHFALKAGGWWLLVLCIAVPVAAGRARKCHMTIVHQAVHNQLFQLRSPRSRQLVNRVFAELLGVLVWIPDFNAYRASHAVSHHSLHELATPRDLDARELYMMGVVEPGGARSREALTATPLDDDGREIFRIGFLPGRPREYYWSLMWRTIASPRFYVADFVKRVRYGLFAAPAYRRISSFAFVCAALVAAWLTSGWLTLLLLYVLPVFPLFRLSGLLQQLSEHMWGVHMGLVGSPERLPLVCQGRFLFDELPARDAGQLQWARAMAVWCARVPYHLLVRVCVLCGDLQFHNDHHFHPRSPRWVDAMRECTQHIRDDRRHHYTHSWSLGEALDRVFTAMAAAPPLEREWLDDLCDK